MPHHHYTRPPCKVIAHRGNSAHAPENTLIAFKQAIEFKVNFLECDVQLTKDNVPVVMHDKTFHRITAERRRHEVNRMTLEEITNIDAGSWFNEKFSDQRILTLKEFLTLPKGPIGMMLDIKKETVTECDLANVVGDVIKKVKTPGSITQTVLILISFFVSRPIFLNSRSFLLSQVSPCSMNLNH